MVLARVEDMSSVCAHHITSSLDCHLYTIDTLCMSLGLQMQNCLLFLAMPYHISIYNFEDPSSFVRKFLPQRVCVLLQGAAWGVS